jgi:hypothetical protein
MAREKDTQPALTVADLCQAIAEGRVPARQRDDMYVVRRAHLKRLAAEVERRPVRGAPPRRHPAAS